MTIIGQMAGCVALSLLCGCVSMVRELKKPPFPSIVSHNTRVLGIELSYQGYGLRLGGCSDTTTFIPCSTNPIYSPPFADRFKIGQSGLDISITQQIDAGWKDQPPPLMKQLFSPKDQSNQPSSHAIPFAQNQTNHPITATIGALDSAAPVFALQFSDTDRRPIAVLELNADDALNTYKIIGTITYTNMPPMPR